MSVHNIEKEETPGRSEDININYFRELLRHLYNYLTGKDVIINSNIIRKHSRDIQQLGDLSFPLNLLNWHNHVDQNQLGQDIETIFQYLRHPDGETTTDSLVSASKLWPLQIFKCVVTNNNAHVYLERVSAFARLIEAAVSEKERYGRCDLQMLENVFIEVDHNQDEDLMNLSELRLVLLRNVAENLFKFCDVNVMNSESDCKTRVKFTLKSKREFHGTIVLCGGVIKEKGGKDLHSTAKDFLRKRTVDMRLMAEHKYGLRVTSREGWREFFEKLGEAAVIIELLQNKPSHVTKINIDDHLLTSSKGASFILYNCARLAALFKEFGQRVSSNVYPQLPDLASIDFGLLKEPEEWELLYVYVMQFPLTIDSCIRDVLKSKFSPHFLTAFLSGMSLLFSVYYRRVRILIEPREHLFPILYARIYLLKALEQVMHNGLRLLNIQPVKQM